MNSNLILNKRLNEIAIIIPVYEGNSKLKKSVKELLSTDFALIIVVDDGSTLNKAEKVLNGINNNRLTILNHDVNRGKGAALKTAFKHCLSKNHKINGVITMDGDGQHNPKYIKPMLNGDNQNLINKKNIKFKKIYKSNSNSVNFILKKIETYRLQN